MFKCSEDLTGSEAKKIIFMKLKTVSIRDCTATWMHCRCSLSRRQVTWIYKCNPRSLCDAEGQIYVKTVVSWRGPLPLNIPIHFFLFYAFLSTPKLLFSIFLSIFSLFHSLFELICVSHQSLSRSSLHRVCFTFTWYTTSRNEIYHGFGVNSKWIDFFIDCS